MFKTRIEKSEKKSVTYQRKDGLIISSYYDRERYGDDKYSFVILEKVKLDDGISRFRVLLEKEHVVFNSMCYIVNNFKKA